MDKRRKDPLQLAEEASKAINAQAEETQRVGAGEYKRGAGDHEHNSGNQSKRGSRQKHNGFSHWSGAYP